MNGSPELLEFYLVEAMEYVDALDRLVAGPHALPDADALLATTRALRGSSTMAKVQPIADISLAMEQIANRCRDGELRWSESLYQALRSTVDDLRPLVRDVRIWSEREQGRAEACRERLRPFLPSNVRRPPTPSASATTPVFLALQSAAIAAELDAFVDNPGNRRPLDDALSRSRTIQGIAGIADHPPLGDVAEVIERAGRKLMPDAPLSPDEHELFRAAANVMRHASEQLRTAGRHEPEQSDLARFARAVSALETPQPADVPVVRIDQLFYLDEGPHVVQRGADVNTTPAQRLASELVARGEHLRHLANQRRHANDLVARERSLRELQQALRDVAAHAKSFGAVQLSTACEVSARTLAPGEPDQIDQVERICSIMADSFVSIEELESRATAFLGARSTPEATVVAPPREPRARPTPTGRDLQDLLATGIQRLGGLESETWEGAVAVDEEEIVPVESLLYRGSAALTRAIEVRDDMLARGETDGESLQEIFDLLDLARTQ